MLSNGLGLAGLVCNQVAALGVPVPSIEPPVTDLITITSSDGAISNQTESGDDLSFTISGAAVHNGTFTVSKTALATGVPINLVFPSAVLAGDIYTFDMGLWIAPSDDQPAFATKLLRGGQVEARNVTSYAIDVYDAERTLEFEVEARNVGAGQSVLATVQLQAGLQFTQSGLVVAGKSIIRPQSAPALAITPRKTFVSLVSHRMDSASTGNLMLVGSPANALVPFYVRRNGFNNNFFADYAGTNARIFGQNQYAFDTQGNPALIGGDNQNLGAGEHPQVTTICIAQAGGNIQVWESLGGNFALGQSVVALGGTDIDLSDIAFEYPHNSYNGTLYRGAMWLTDAAMPDFESNDFRDSILLSDGSLAPPKFAQLIFGETGSGLLFDFHGTAADATSLTFEGDLATDTAMTLRAGGSFSDE